MRPAVRVTRPIALVLALAAVAAGGFLALDWIEAPRARPAAAKAPNLKPRPLIPTPPEPSKRSSVSEGVEAYRTLFRFPPDRRFQRALADIHRIAAGAESAPIEVTWSGDTWELRRGAEVLGRGEALPGFAALFDVLVTQAKRELAANPPAKPVSAVLSPESGRAFFARDAFPALRALGEQWQAGARSPELALRAAQRLTELYLQTPGEMEYTDPLAARALAALALARALDAEAGRTEECLLALAFGHSTRALEIARALPANDPAAALALRRVDVLRDAAARPNAPDRIRYLNLLSVLERRDDDASLREMGRWAKSGSVDSAVVGAIYWEPTFQLMRELPPFQLTRLVEESLHESPPRGDAFEWAMTRAAKAERAMAAAAESVSGPFLDRDVQYAADAGRLFEALRGVFWFRKRWLASEPAMADALAKLPKDESPAVEEFRRFFDAFLTWDHPGERQKRRGMAASLTTHVGPALRLEMLGMSTATPGSDSTQGEREDAGRFLATLDSRLSHRESAIEVVDLRLRDQARKDWLETAIVREDEPRREKLRVDLLARHGGIGAILDALEKGDLRGASLSSALDKICCNPEVEIPRARKIFAKLAEQPQLREAMYYAYSRFLTDRAKDLAASEAWSRAYLADPQTDHGFVRPLAAAELARVLRLAGKTKESWALLEPMISSQITEVMMQGIRTLLAQERFAEAESLAKATLQRYPYAGSRIELARVYWRSGRSDDATRLLTPPGYTLIASDWVTVADRFEHGMEGQSDEKVLEAFDSLVRADSENTPYERAVRIPEHFAREGKKELAFEMFWRIARFNLAVMNNPKLEVPVYEPPEKALRVADWRIPFLVSAWRTKRELAGAQAADAWILAFRTHPLIPDFAHQFFQAGAYSLLWTMFPEASVHVEVSLLRAEAAVLDPEIMTSHGDELRALFAKPGDSFEHRMARIVLGIENDPEALREQLPPEQLCQMEYYLGVAAQARGELGLASDLYQASLSTNRTRYAAYQNSALQLEAWRAANQSFAAAQISAPPASPR